MFRMKQIGYRPGEIPGQYTDPPPRGLLCYPFRATAFQALVLQEQLSDLGDLLARYQKSVSALETRLRQTTNIRFQPRGRKASTQGYFGWVMIFDHPDYRDTPREMIFKALSAEGLQLHYTWGPVWKFRLFNLDPSCYRVHGACPVTEHTTDRMLWINHSYLGLDPLMINRIGDAIEKVVTNIEELRAERQRIAV
jgi:dTDP-4-amino-4,6-dideoxygalactose transaminase